MASASHPGGSSWLMAVLLTIVASPSAGEPTVPVDDTKQARAAAIAERLTVALNGGAFRPASNSGQLDYDTRAYTWGLSAGYVFNEHVSADAEFLWFTGDYTRVGAVLPNTTGNDVRILSLGFGANLRLSYPFQHCTPFVVLGLGNYSVDLLTVRPGDSGFSADHPAESDRGLGQSLGVGVGIPVASNTWVDLTWRRLRFDADFGVYSSGSVEAGGDFIGLSLRWGGN